MQVTTVIKESIAQVLKNWGLEVNVKEIVIEYPADSSHGDLASNIAMTLFSKIKQLRSLEFGFSSPRELAQKLVAELSEIQLDGIAKIETAGPGFINFTLSNAFLLSKMGLIIKKHGDVLDKLLSGQKIMIEFTDPNPFKELHIGHLYSNVVGESVSRLQEALGAQVVRACYQGDVGMHVAKSIWGMQQLVAKEFPGREPDVVLAELEQQSLSARIKFLGRSYATGASAYKDDEQVKKEIQELNYLVFIAAQESLVSSTGFKPKVDYRQFVPVSVLESLKFETVKRFYLTGRAWSLEYFELMYSRIGMKFDEFFFESLMAEHGYEIVLKYLDKGVFQKSNGAIIFPGSKYGLHDRVFINSLGLPTYEAKELGLPQEKYRRFQYDASIVITANEVDEYFKVVFKALEFTNKQLQQKTHHLSHGMVRLPEGKMSSRTGNVLTAEWLIEEATKRVKDYMQLSRPDASEDFINQVAATVALGAIKYAFLKQSIDRDISFSFSESLSFNGNSGPYLQYTYVRCLSVLEKAQNGVLEELLAKGPNLTESLFSQEDFDELLTNIALHFDTLLNNKAYLEIAINSDERDVLLNLYKYSDIVKSATLDYAPHYLANYLYELAQSFSGFYARHKIIVEDEQKAQLRLLLVLAVAYVIKNGLELLGIKVVNRM